MVTRTKTKYSNTICLIALMISLLLSVNIGSGQGDSLGEVQKKLKGISDEERIILQNLFTIVQEIREVEHEEEQITQEKKRMTEEIEALKAGITDEEIAYDKKKTILKEVLKTYQKRGPGTYLEIVLASDSLTTMIRRMNALRDLTRNTGKLLDDLEVSREMLSDRKEALEKKIVLAEEKQRLARESLNKKLQRVKDLEAYLSSLNDEKDYYKGQLENIEIMWKDVKAMFTMISQDFSSMIKSNDLPQDAVKINVSLLGIKGSIREETFNNMMIDRPSFPKLKLHFYPGQVVMDIPEKNFVLSGTFIILEGNKLQFHIEEGSFYGMPLGQGALDELMEGGYPTIDLKPLMGDYMIKSFKLMDEKLEFIVTSKSF